MHGELLRLANGSSLALRNSISSPLSWLWVSNHPPRPSANLAAAGDVYVCFEGGPGVAEEACMAFSRGGEWRLAERLGDLPQGQGKWPSLTRLTIMADHHWPWLISGQNDGFMVDVVTIVDHTMTYVLNYVTFRNWLVDLIFFNV